MGYKVVIQDITYYEEFGIPTSATPEEIHQAHRRLIKILHPDLQTDEANRQLAEVQTRRVNRIAQILLDPDERNEYEASLHAPPRGILQLQRLRLKKGYDTAANFAITGVFVLAALWMLQSDRPTTLEQPADASSMTAAPTSVKPKSDRERTTLQPKPLHTESKLPVVSDPPKIPITEPSRQEAVLEALSAAQPETPPDRTEERKPATAAAPPERQPRASDAPAANNNAKSLTGTWIYVPGPALEEDRKVYSPEYIEMRIRSADGVLEGQYRARYHVPDRPLSPNVAFRFTGSPPGGALATKMNERPLNYRWTASNGLGGQVEIKVMTADSIQVDWRVTEHSESADLISGSAVLTRVR